MENSNLPGLAPGATGTAPDPSAAPFPSAAPSFQATPEAAPLTPGAPPTEPPAHQQAGAAPTGGEPGAGAQTPEDIRALYEAADRRASEAEQRASAYEQERAQIYQGLQSLAHQRQVQMAQAQEAQALAQAEAYAEQLAQTDPSQAIRWMRQAADAISARSAQQVAAIQAQAQQQIAQEREVVGGAYYAEKQAAAHGLPPAFAQTLIGKRPAEVDRDIATYKEHFAELAKLRHEIQQFRRDQQAADAAGSPAHAVPGFGVPGGRDPRTDPDSPQYEPRAHLAAMFGGG